MDEIFWCQRMGEVNSWQERRAKSRKRKALSQNTSWKERRKKKILHFKRITKQRYKISYSIDKHEEEVTVICEFVECFTSFSDALRRFDAVNHTEKKYESQEGEYIYNIHYVITD